MKIVKFTETNMRNYEKFLRKHEVSNGRVAFPVHTYVSKKTYKKMESVVYSAYKKMAKGNFNHNRLMMYTETYMMNIAPCICDGLQDGKMLIDTKSLAKEVFKNK
jgi:hypothetical protein